MRQRKSLSYSVRKRLWLVGFLLLIDLALPKNGSMRLHEPDRATAAMMIALDRHRKYVPESEKYYEKKRAQGKSHNQAIRALGRHLCRSFTKCSEKNESTRSALRRGYTQPKVKSRSSRLGQIRKKKNL